AIAIISFAGAAMWLAASGSDAFEATVKPFVRQNCAVCHNAKVSSGDLDLEQFLTQPESVALKDRERWEKVVQRLRAREMPPKGAHKPPQEQIAAVTKAIEIEFARLDRNAK